MNISTPISGEPRRVYVVAVHHPKDVVPLRCKQFHRPQYLSGGYGGVGDAATARGHATRLIDLGRLSQLLGRLGKHERDAAHVIPVEQDLARVRAV